MLLTERNKLMIVTTLIVRTTLIPNIRILFKVKKKGGSFPHVWKVILHAKKANCNPEKGFCMPSLLNFAILKNKFVCHINHFALLKNTICIPEKYKCMPKRCMPDLHFFPSRKSKMYAKRLKRMPQK
jgi:hypothetical protein